ncbi:ETEC_3214 domain-containing protein [Mycobacterium sp. IS-2888]|uniref:ETEC_3214 domain-containing protein n=1 Tax=Mycobacterium sp. IS-2888 TaxID=1834159 RepID=UPI001115598E|nr:ETEC_3214 domain-containing protein [Mycobacterium sp. IS-2888]
MTPTMDFLYRSLGAGAATAALLSASWGIVKLIATLYRRTVGRRRAQAKLLDQLACSSSVDYIESLLGVAQFITTEDGREQRTYHLPGAWVMVELADNVVIAFSITITSRRMYYNIKRLTFGFLDLNLGKSKFSGPDIGYRGERLWIGAYRIGYLRAYYYARQGGYQHYWLSYNMAGAGSLTTARNTPSLVETGVFVSAATHQPSQFDVKNPIDASGITVNTLTVLHPEGPGEDFHKRHILGPDEARVRLARTLRPPLYPTLLIRMRYKRYRLLRQARRCWPTTARELGPTGRPDGTRAPRR